jgi:hypothetical protein
MSLIKHATSSALPKTQSTQRVQESWPYKRQFKPSVPKNLPLPQRMLAISQASLVKVQTGAQAAAQEVGKQTLAKSIQQGAFGEFLKTGAGGAATAGLGLVGKYIQEKDKADGTYSKAGAMAGGALQGASLGAALGPLGMLAGGAIGAGVGVLQKEKFEQNARAEELTKQTNEARKAHVRKS